MIIHSCYVPFLLFTFYGINGLFFALFLCLKKFGDGVSFINSNNICTDSNGEFFIILTQKGSEEYV
ncbi:hypothetical protein PAECIP112173_03305 [Paenibacillus sp. JJ-100]|nr:hypothetical protein PAECIP112173_03305 [Paenibacillus sp. JJ-100]